VTDIATLLIGDDKSRQWSPASAGEKGTNPSLEEECHRTVDRGNITLSAYPAEVLAEATFIPAWRVNMALR